MPQTLLPHISQSSDGYHQGLCARYRPKRKCTGRVPTAVEGFADEPLIRVTDSFMATICDPDRRAFLTSSGNSGYYESGSWPWMACLN